MEGLAWGEKGREIGGYVNNRLTVVHKMTVWYIIYTIKKKCHIFVIFVGFLMPELHWLTLRCS